jgi:hypothetical protein
MLFLNSTYPEESYENTYSFYNEGEAVCVNELIFQLLQLGLLPLREGSSLLMMDSGGS